jgi:hypothetical protein
MAESVRREIPAIHGQNLPDVQIVVDDGEKHGVDVRERLIAVLGKNVSCSRVHCASDSSHLKEIRVRIDQREDRQRNTRVFPRANAAVVAELRKRFSDDEVRHYDSCAPLSSGKEKTSGPGMMQVASVDRGNEQAGISENGQARRPYCQRLPIGRRDLR